jgi:NADH pyrophosphatase NudC (nudix superfamily)
METSDMIGDIQKSEIYDYQWFDVDDILMMQPNVETWDFYQEMLEKIVGSDGEE